MKSVPKEALSFLLQLKQNNDRDWFNDHKGEFKSIESEMKDFYKEIELKLELEKNVNLVSFKSQSIEISFNENLDKNFIKNLTSKLLDWTGQRWIITLSKKQGAKSISESEAILKKNNLKKLEANDFYKKMITSFPDAEITKIKNLDDEKK